MKESCRNCGNLHLCTVVTGKMVQEQDRCDNYETATKPEIAANRTIIKDFGAWALSCDAPAKTISANRPHRRSRRRHRNG